MGDPAVARQVQAQDPAVTAEGQVNLEKLITEVKAFVHAMIKARSNLRIYPENNQMYLKTIDEVFAKLTKILETYEYVTLVIHLHDISFENEIVYHSEDTQDDLALTLFRDGVKTITFHNNIPREELKVFLRIISRQFEGDDDDDVDIVSMIWEKDFRFIKYDLYEMVLAEDEDYETQGIDQVQKAIGDRADLFEAYEEITDGCGENDPGTSTRILPISESDKKHITQSIEEDHGDRVAPLFWLLFEMLGSSEDEAQQEEVGFFRAAFLYGLKNGDFDEILSATRKIGEICVLSDYPAHVKKCAKGVQSFLHSKDFLVTFLAAVDSKPEIDEDLVRSVMNTLGMDSAKNLVELLSRVKKPGVREIIMDLLCEFGRKDLKVITVYLKDWRWFVVRDMIHILQRIDGREALEQLGSTLHNTDARVRKEALQVLGRKGGEEALEFILDCVHDSEESVRKVALQAIAAVGGARGKEIIVDLVKDKEFFSNEFEEKRVILEALSCWRDDESFEILTGILKKTSFFKRVKTDENRAAAAYCLGVMGDPRALEALDKLKKSRNEFLRENVNSAISRLKNEA